MAAYEKISAEQALNDLHEAATYLVNGYEEEQKWNDTRVPGAISYAEYKQLTVDIPKETELMFYCA